MPHDSVSALYCKLVWHTKSIVKTVIKIKTIKNTSIKTFVHLGDFYVWDLNNSDVFIIFKLKQCLIYMVLVVVWLALALALCNTHSPVAFIDQVMSCATEVERWSKWLCKMYEKLLKPFLEKTKNKEMYYGRYQFVNVVTVTSNHIRNQKYTRNKGLQWIKFSLYKI
jgi:hypothetical protein